MSNIITFYGKKDYLSNFYHSSYILNGKTFSCVEQGFMYYKAKFFNDKEIAKEILELEYNDKPAEYKKLGRKVKNFDKDKWNDVRIGIMKMNVKEKITQSKDIKEYLLTSLKDKIIVEASPRDMFWGVGVGKEKALDKNKWRGKNMLGNIIMEIRDELNGQ